MNKLSKIGKAYKADTIINVNMIPSDPTGSLDDFILSWRFVWRRQ